MELRSIDFQEEVGGLILRGMHKQGKLFVRLPLGFLVEEAFKKGFVFLGARPHENGEDVIFVFEEVRW